MAIERLNVEKERRWSRYLFGEFERVKMKGRLCFWINLFIFLIFICPKSGFKLFFSHLAKNVSVLIRNKFG
jgi:cytochrome b subunit of formate dehydrogenase